MNTGNEPPVPADDNRPGRTSDEQTRDGKGHFIPRLDTARRDAQAAELRAEGWKLGDIAAELGYHDATHARQGIHRALREIRKGPAEKLIAHEAERLDALYEEALNVLQRDHITVSHGRIITDDDGNPILDDGPKLAAIDRLVKVRESYRKLLGLDAPSRVSVDAQQLGDEISALLNRATGDDDTGA